MTQALIQECLAEGGRVKSRRPERSGVAFARTPSAAGAPAFDNRQIVNGILWRIRTGAPRRDLPEKYGKWMTVYQTSDDGARPASGKRSPRPLPQAMADNSPGFDDGSRSCLGCRRKRGTREQAFGRSRGGFTCKVHCLSDARGIPLVFHLTPGEAADSGQRQLERKIDSFTSFYFCVFLLEYPQALSSSICSDCNRQRHGCGTDEIF